MNRSEQSREELKTKTLSELEELIPVRLCKGDKQLVKEVQELLKPLADMTERALQMLEIGSDLLQKGGSSLDGDLSNRGNKLDDEALQDKFVSSPLQDEPHGDTATSGIPSLASPEVFYIRYQDPKSKGGEYVSKPDRNTRFQITVFQSNPHVGILQFYDELDKYRKEEIIGNMSYTLVEKERGGATGHSQGYQEEYGEVHLDPASNTWKLIKAIKIK